MSSLSWDGTVGIHSAHRPMHCSFFTRPPSRRRDAASSPSVCAVGEHEDRPSCPTTPLLPSCDLIAFILQAAIHVIGVSLIRLCRACAKQAHEQPPHRSAGRTYQRSLASRAGNRSTDRSAGSTHSTPDRCTGRHTARLAAAFLCTGRFGQLFARFNILFRHLFPNRLQMCVRIQHRLRAGAGAEHESCPAGPGNRSSHRFTDSFGTRQAMTCSAVFPITHTRLCRPPAPDSMRTAATGTDNSPARKRISSSFAAPSEGGAAIRILRALP